MEKKRKLILRLFNKYLRACYQFSVSIGSICGFLGKWLVWTFIMFIVPSLLLYVIYERIAPSSVTGYVFTYKANIPCSSYRESSKEKIICSSLASLQQHIKNHGLEKMGPYATGIKNILDSKMGVRFFVRSPAGRLVDYNYFNHSLNKYAKGSRVISKVALLLKIIGIFPSESVAYTIPLPLLSKIVLSEVFFQLPEYQHRLVLHHELLHILWATEFEIEEIMRS